MSKSKIYLILIALLLLTGATQTFAQTVPPNESEPKLIAVLKSDAPHKQKADAFRQLSFIATKDSIPTLAALLADEKLSHMARYALESISDPAADVAFRSALGKLKGPQLVGVIGSIGVRKDTKAIPALIKLLNDKNPQAAAAAAAARSLGDIGNSAAAKALQAALAKAPEKNKPALDEGLFASDFRDADLDRIRRRCVTKMAKSNDNGQDKGFSDGIHTELLFDL